MNRLCTLILSIGLTYSLVGAADLTITAKGVRSADGAVLLAVYDSNESFMKAPQAKATRRLDGRVANHNLQIALAGVAIAYLPAVKKRASFSVLQVITVGC